MSKDLLLNTGSTEKRKGKRKIDGAKIKTYEKKTTEEFRGKKYFGIPLIVLSLGGRKYRSYI